MNFRPIIERPQKPREELTDAPFGRAGSETTAARMEPVSRNLVNDINRLMHLAERQVAQSNEMLQSLAALITFLSREGSAVRPGVQTDAIDARLRRIEDLLTRSASGPAPPSPPPVRNASARALASPGVGRAAPQAQTVQAKDAAQDFAAAFRALAAECGIEHADAEAAKIEASANEQGLPWDSRADALVKAAFGLVSRVDCHAPVGALRTFVQRLLGPSAALIQPKPADAFDPSAHHDVSVEVTGSRSRVRDAIFPGVRVAERVLVRALIHT